MATRQPIGAPEILDKVIHAGKNSVSIAMASTPVNPLEGFGFNAGNFYALLPLTAVAVSKSTTVELPLRVIDAYFVTDGSNGAGQSISVKKTDSTGATTTLFTLTAVGTANEVIRALTKQSTWAQLALAAGDTLTVDTAALNATGTHVFVSVVNL